MKKNNIILQLITALVLMACSAETVEREKADRVSEELIKFEAPTFHKIQTSTRGSVYTDITDLQKAATDIRVTAKYTSDHSTVYINNERLQYKDGVWTINKYFWIPDTHLDFFAEVVAGNGDMTNFTSAKSNITNYTFDYTVPTDISKQYDYIYATSLNKYKEDIPLNFTHALSQIVFEASVSENWTVYIQSITIKNVLSKGTFTYKNEAERGNEWSNQQTYTDYPFTLSTPKVFNGASAAERLLAVNDYRLVLLPQTLTPWVLGTSKETIATADANHHSYLEISCRIKNNADDSWYAGSSDYSKIYTPLSGTWEPNKKYTYTLQFGAGYNSSGDKTIDQVTMSVKIDDWTTGETGSGMAEFD